MSLAMNNKYVWLQLKPLKRLVRKMVANPISPTLGRQWAAIYLAAMRRRFATLSRGGSVSGQKWKGHAPSTRKAHARKPKAKRSGGGASKGGRRKRAILRDTGTTYNGLSLGAPGNLFKRRPRYVLVGYGGGAKHKGSGGTKIADIARYHDKGLGRNPKRPIIVEPDKKTTELLAIAMQAEIERQGRKYGGAAA